MNTIVLYFSDHAPVRFTGDPIMCALQIMNARKYPGFISWDEIRSTRTA